MSCLKETLKATKHDWCVSFVGTGYMFLPKYMYLEYYLCILWLHEMHVNISVKTTLLCQISILIFRWTLTSLDMRPPTWEISSPYGAKECMYWGNILRHSSSIVPDVVSYCHTALFEILSRIVGKITTHYLLSRNIFLPVWGLQILRCGLRTG